MSMKFKAPVTLNILTPRSLFRPNDFLNAVQTYCELLPGVLPERWWWAESPREFDLQNLQALIPTPEDKLQVRQSVPPETAKNIPPEFDTRCETVNWDRKKKPKAEGSFSPRWCSKAPSVRDTHANMNVTVELGQVAQQELVTCLKQASVRLNAHFALMDTLTASYKEFAGISGSAKYSDRFYVVTHELRHCLPDIFWGTVFGPPYVALFGKEKLLNAPVFAAEQIAENMVYIQLTQDITDVANDPAAMALHRKAFKDYLGVDAFFVEGRGYDSYSRLEYGPVGKIFVTPEFELAKD